MNEPEKKTINHALSGENGNAYRNSRNDVIEIDLMEIWYLFLRKIRIVLACAIIGGILTGLYTHLWISKKYEATSTLYIVSASSSALVNLSDLNLGSSLTKDYAELIMTRPLFESVAENLDLDMSASAIREMITINNPSNTRVLEITVTGTDPELCMDIANEVAKVSVTWLSDIMEMNEPNIVEEAVLPTAPISPSVKKNIAIGAILAAVLYFGVVVAAYILDDTVRTGDELEKYFGIVPLASIPEEKSLRENTTKHINKSVLSALRNYLGGKK